MKLRLHQAFSAITLLALFCAAQPAQPKRIKSRALVVGVNEYAQKSYVKPTPGAEEDALAAKEFIKRQYGFLDGEIKVLTGPQATAANIVNTFREWLIEGTEPGDRVYFHYSGHGSRVRDDNRDEEDGYDEVIAPYDVELRDKTFINVITDDEIGQLIAQLSGRLAVMLFDSCHSGTISRGRSGGAATDRSAPRFLPSPEELAALRSTQGTARGRGGFADYGVQDDKQTSRDLKLVDERTVGPATGIVVISAAQSGQLAYPMRVNGGARGALSHVFSDVQDERPLTLRQLEQEIAQRIRALQKKGNLKGQQVPSFEVISTVPLDDQPLFGSSLIVPAVALANPQSVVKLTLRTRDGKSVYQFDEKVSYQVGTDKAGYLYLLVFSENDVVTRLFPNEDDRNNRVEARTHIFPREKSSPFVVGPPAGKDTVVALLSATRLDLEDKDKYSWSEVFERLKSKRFTEFLKQARGQTVQKPAGLTDWQAVSLVLEAVEKSHQDRYTARGHNLSFYQAEEERRRNKRK